MIRNLKTGFVLPMLAVVFLAGCSDASEKARLTFQSRDMLSLGSGSPRVSVKAYHMKGEWVWPRAHAVKESSVLEFLPLAAGKVRDKARMEVYLLDGKEVSLLHTCKPVFFQAKSFPKKERLGIMQYAVRVTVGPLKSDKAYVKWVLKNKGAPMEGAVGNPKIYPQKGLAEKKPDILFICSDTHRFDVCFGEKGPTLMPGLQALGKESVIYRNACSNASWTMPSLASTLTGLFPRYHRSGFRVDEGEEAPVDDMKAPPGPGRFLFNTGGVRRVFTVYPSQLLTLTEHLQAQGYVTAMAASNPLYQLSGLHADGQDIFLATGVVAGDEVNEMSMEIMARRPKDRPLFLLVHYMEAHQWRPWYYDKAFPDTDPKKNRDSLMSSYEQAVIDTDRNLTALVERWDQEVGLDESMVTFYSDHGEHLLDPGHAILGHGNSMDESLLHVPLMVHYPRRLGIPPGEETRLVSLVDLSPTVLDLVGAAPGKETLHGRSLLGLSSGESDTPRHSFADSQLFGESLSSVRTDLFKLVLNLDSGSGKILDISLPLTDAGEPGQVISNEKLLKELQTAFEEYARTAEAAAAELKLDHMVDQDQALEDLKALGYAK